MTRKPTPEELQKAYKDLELPPGAGPKEVKKMYRFLSYMFSADRVQQSPQSFIDRATEKHKAINNAKDILDEHFKNWHRETDCDCQEPDPKIYEQKAKAAEERFEQEREAARQRAAQEAAEREARAQDAARRASRRMRSKPDRLRKQLMLPEPASLSISLQKLRSLQNESVTMKSSLLTQFSL